ncbi:MAG: hypothetical protein C0402_03185, partial [Thermodesulfovibrio sp.]|nr:hypothetical protein [Thermodesulfovibrio sp.]
MKRFNLATLFLLFILGTVPSVQAAITALDGFNPNLNGDISSIAVQSDGKILVGGRFTNNIVRLNPDGSVDASFNMRTIGGPVETITVVKSAGGRDTIYIGGGFTSITIVNPTTLAETSAVRNYIAKLNLKNDENWSLDTAIDAFNPNANSDVYAIAVQTDGKIVIGGAFTKVNAVDHMHLARLTAAGVPDGAFAQTNGDVYTIALQVDGSMLIGGAFSTISQSSSAVPAAVAPLGASVDRRRLSPAATASQALATGSITPNAIFKGIARLTPAGTFDTTSFTSAQLGDFAGLGAVYSIVVHPDGHVIFGGDFSITKDATTINNLARTTFNGILDKAFNPAPNSIVISIAIQSDGNLLAGGAFSGNLARINRSSGSLTPLGSGFSDPIIGPAVVYAVEEQFDGKILAGGSFAAVGTAVRNNLARFYPDGVLETDFDLAGAVTGEIYAVKVQPGGKVLIGGRFTSVAGEPRTNLARFNSDGSLDALATFVDGPVYALELDLDQNILVGGSFTCVGSGADSCTTRNNAARLDPDGILISFNPNVNGTVYAIRVQADGKALLGGKFTTVNSVQRNNLVRLDTGTWTPDLLFYPSINNTVRAIAVQGDDGKIVIGGSFGSILSGGITSPRNLLARLDSATGLVDSSFIPIVTGTVVNAIAIQAGGKIIFGGSFSQVYDGSNVAQSRNNTARLDTTNWKADSFNPDVTGTVNAITLDKAGNVNDPADDLIYLGGSFTRVGGVSGTDLNNFARIDDSGILTGAATPSVNASVNALAMDGSNVVLGGAFTVVAGVARPFVARLDSAGVVSDLNNPGNGLVKAVAFQADGKMLVGGTFSSIGGQLRSLIARFHVNGTLDDTFTPVVPGTSVNAIAVQEDGNILVGGQNAANLLLVRYTPSGALDTFTHGLSGESVNAIAVQPDNKILVGGAITGLIVRLDSTGASDSGFTPASVAGTSVNAIALQTDGKILLGGDLSNPLVRLTSAGAADIDYLLPAGSVVHALSIQSDGLHILVGGSFSLGLGVANLIRIPTAGGSNDLSVYPNNAVKSIALAADGSFFVGGDFTQIGAASRPYIARLKSTGALDPAFDPAPDQAVTAAGIQPDGKVVIGGSFLAVSGTPRYGLAKLVNVGSAGASLDVPDITQITWSRMGGLPEVSRVVFETSPDDLPASTWTTVSASATRGTNTWSQIGLSLEQNKSFYLRARGYIIGGENGGSISVVEMKNQVYLPAKPIVTTDNVNPTNPFFAELKGTVSNAP